ncbi:hypothetical protein ScPMuIL_001809 [Solemya velum]
MANRRHHWDVPACSRVRKIHNPFMKYFVDSTKIKPNTNKDVIALAVGDPTFYGNMPTHAAVMDAMMKTLTGNNPNGYVDFLGSMEARKAIAQYITSTETPLQAENIIVTLGCIGALDLCIACIANPGQNILIPRPQFPIYKVICDSYEIEVKFYDSMPENNWEMNLEHMESLIDQKTAAILINNPATPMGVVYSKRHLLDFLAVAERNKLPVIADEIYAHMVFSGSTFYSLGSLSKTVPILSCCSLSKRFLVPGWRVGWIAIHDRNGVFEKQVCQTLKASAGILGSPSAVHQKALPDIFKNVPSKFFDDTVAYLERNATLLFQIFMEIPGLTPLMPRTAIFMMIKISLEKFPEFQDDQEMAEQLATEQNVYCMPGELFLLPGYLRITITLPEDKIIEACDRIKQFCAKYYKSSPSTAV